jgi:hypothetical protein
MAGWNKQAWLWNHGLFSLLLGGLVYRTLVAIWLLPGFDEAYYYLYSRHLNWSYFDHPAMVALTTGVGWWLTGVISPLTIRLGALGLYVVSLVLLYLAATRLYTAAVGQLTVALVTLIPLFTIAFGILTSPDNGLMVFWSATLLVALWEFFPTEQRFQRHGRIETTYEPTWRLALLGGLVGLAVLSKYHGFILGLGLVGFCLTCRPYQSALRSPWILAALGLFTLTTLPLWYWNYQHDWVSFRFHLGMRFEGGTRPSNPFSLGQLLGYWLLSNVYLFPLFGLPLWWVIARQSGRQLIGSLSPTHDPRERQPEDQRALILWLSLPIVLLFTLLGGKQQIFPAWPAPGYWGLTIWLGAQALVWQRRRPWLVRRWLWGSGFVLLALSGVALLHLQLGFLQKPSTFAPFGGFIALDQDGSTELIDTEQLRQRLVTDPQIQSALSEVGFVFTNEYYLGGYFDMALHPLAAIPVTAFSQDPRGFAFWFDQTQWLGQDALYMTLDRFVEDAAILAGYSPLFDTLEPLTTLPLQRGGQVTEIIHIFRAKNFRQPYQYPY